MSTLLMHISSHISAYIHTMVAAFNCGLNKVKVYLDAIDIKRININGFLGKCVPLIPSPFPSLPVFVYLLLYFLPNSTANVPRFSCLASERKCEQLYRLVCFSGCGHVRPLQPPEIVFLFLVHPLSSVVVWSAHKPHAISLRKKSPPRPEGLASIGCAPCLSGPLFFNVMGDLSITLSFA